MFLEHFLLLKLDLIFLEHCLGRMAIIFNTHSLQWVEAKFFVSHVVATRWQALLKNTVAISRIILSIYLFFMSMPNQSI